MASRRRPAPAAIVDAAEEVQILAAMRAWPRAMEDQLRAHGFENFAGGSLLWQQFFERKLADPREPTGRA